MKLINDIRIPKPITGSGRLMAFMTVRGCVRLAGEQ